METFGSTFKTISVGVLLINALYEGNPNVGLYTLPLLIWHPMQLVLGSFLAPRLHRFVQRERNGLVLSTTL
jgi:sodium/bile acid cotransporter 7